VVHLVIGFVGISSTGGLIGDFGTNFGNNVGNLNGIVAAWLNEAANWWVFGGNTAIAIACGVDADQAKKRLILRRELISPRMLRRRITWPGVGGSEHV
jgi:hypothetical protein